MKKKISVSALKAGGGIAGLAIFLAILAALNIIAGNLRLRKDLTSERRADQYYDENLLFKRYREKYNEALK